LVLALGVVGLGLSAIHVLAVIGTPLSLAAWVMGARDLGKMDRGEMDPRGWSGTRAGKRCGVIGTMVGLLWLAVLLCVGGISVL
jgi:hypothetical protein